MSNFADVRLFERNCSDQSPTGYIEYDGLKYASTEHAYQAQKYEPNSRHHFTLDGILSKWETIDNYPKVFGKLGTDRWKSKNNIGIIPKYVSSDADRGLLLGLKRLKNFQRDPLIWKAILTQKFNNHPKLKAVLLGSENPSLPKNDSNPYRATKYSGDEYLLEFGIGDKR